MSCSAGPEDPAGRRSRTLRTMRAAMAMAKTAAPRPMITQITRPTWLLRTTYFVELPSSRPSAVVGDRVTECTPMLREVTSSRIEAR